MSRYVGAIDQGTTSSRFIVFDHKGRIVSAAQKEHAADLPQARLGRARRRGNLAQHQGRDRRRARQTGPDPRRSRGGRRHQPARNHGPLGQDHRPAAPQRAGVAGHAHRPARGPTRRRWRPGPVARQNRTSARHVFLGAEAALAARERSGRAGQSRGGRRALRQHRHVAALEPDRRPGGRPAHHRRHQRLAHPVDEPAKRSTGTTICWRCSRSRAPACRRIVSSSEVYGRARGPARRRAVSGALGDQQAALFGQACLRPGEAKNTYGTGCFMLMNTGETDPRSTCGLLTTLGYKLGEQQPVYALEGSIAIAGALVQWLRDNLGLIETAPEIEALAQTRPRQRRRLFRAGLLGPLRAALEGDARAASSAGLTRFANKGHIARAALEATAYQTREVLDAMAQGFRGVEITRAAGGRRHGRQRTPDAVPGRHPERAGGPSEGDRDDRARRGLRGRARGRLLEIDGRHFRQLGRRQALAAANGREPRATGCTPRGTRRSRGRWTGRNDGGSRCGGGPARSRWNGTAARRTEERPEPGFRRAGDRLSGVRADELRPTAGVRRATAARAPLHPDWRVLLWTVGAAHFRAQAAGDAGPRARGVLRPAGRRLAQADAAARAFGDHAFRRNPSGEGDGSASSFGSAARTLGFPRMAAPVG